MKKESKIAFIARADNSGLGTMSWEFANHIPFEKVLVIKNGVYQVFPERFPNARVAHKDKISTNDIDWLLDGVTHLLTIETPYDYLFWKKARDKGVKIVFIPMYECVADRLPIYPDLYICPSKLDFDVMPKPKKLLSTPINRNRLPFKQRNKANVFLHNAGHGGITGRNGTSELLAAIPMIKEDVKVIINTQRPINYSHPKVEIRVGNFENYWDLWQEGDVFVFPHKFDGLSLPIQEALSVGMPVLSTAIYPFTTWLPQDWFILPEDVVKAKPALREIDYAIVTPKAIADKIDEWAGKDISKDSIQADTLARRLDWKELKDKYIQMICEV